MGAAQVVEVAGVDELVAGAADQLLGLVADQGARPRRGVDVASVGVVPGHHLTERVGEELKTVELGGRPGHVHLSVASRSGFRTKPRFYRFFGFVRCNAAETSTL